jgi:hypothetical protein
MPWNTVCAGSLTPFMTRSSKHKLRPSAFVFFTSPFSIHIFAAERQEANNNVLCMAQRIVFCWLNIKRQERFFWVHSAQIPSVWYSQMDKPETRERADVHITLCFLRARCENMHVHTRSFGISAVAADSSMLECWGINHSDTQGIERGWRAERAKITRRSKKQTCSLTSLGLLWVRDVCAPSSDGENMSTEPKNRTQLCALGQTDDFVKWGLRTSI